MGALDKDSSIAAYSSQGPTEEGRIKPNMAYMGSQIMSVQANSVDQYVAFSGTSMATPGVAGVGALMLQANPDLSPFDIRNILQEQATYRQCHYMGANEPCAEDLIPKNRQNNVYGHGHVNALESVIEAAEYDLYSFNKNITLSVETSTSKDGYIPLAKGESVKIQLSNNMDGVQWMSNDLRHSWSFVNSYDKGNEVKLSFDEIVDELQYLPDVTLLGNHTISVRGLQGTSSSPLITFDVMLIEKTMVADETSGSSDLIIYGSIIAAILLTIVLVAQILKKDDEEYPIAESDQDIDDVVEAEILE